MISVIDKTRKQLDYMKMHHFAVYLNIKENVDAVFRKLLIAESEQEFGGDTFEPCKIYVVLEKAEEIFCNYLGVEAEDISSIELVVHSSMDFAALVVYGNDGYVSKRKFFFEKEIIDDILATFSASLEPQPNEAGEPEEWGSGNVSYCYDDEYGEELYA